MDLAGAPLYIALPIRRWLDERDTFKGLWRLSWCLEFATRYTLAVTLGDLERRLGAIPADLAADLRRGLVLPSFGGWIKLVAAAVGAGGPARDRSPAVAALVAAFEQELVAGLPLDAFVADVRNDLAHADLGEPEAMQRVEDWEPRSRRALEAFVSAARQLQVVYVDGPGRYASLAYRDGGTLPPPAQAAALDHLQGRVAGLDAAGGCAVDLTPLCWMPGPPAHHQAGAGQLDPWFVTVHARLHAA